MRTASADDVSFLPSESPGEDYNLSDLLALLEHLSREEREQLFDELGIPRDSHISDWIYSDNDEMHIHSYEQQLMVYDEYRAHKFIRIYVPPVLLILGTFGNIFSFIILKRKSMLKFSTYIYLMVLAIADLLVLYIGLLRLWIGELTGYDVRDKADWLCKLTNVVGYTVSDFSVWLIIAVTCERYIVVCHPLKASILCNTTRAKMIILLLLLLLLGLNSHFFWTVQIVQYRHDGETIQQCNTGEKHATAVDVAWPWVDAFIYSFLPFVVIVILNGLIIRQVVHARQCRNELHNGSMGTQTRSAHESNTRLTIMLLTISFAFLLTTLPMNGVNIAAIFIDDYKRDLHKVSKFKLASTITQMLMYVNHSMNFYLYCATGQKFRQQLIRLMCYGRRRLPWNSEHTQTAKETSGRFTRNQHSFMETTEVVTCSRQENTYRPLKASIEMSEIASFPKRDSSYTSLTTTPS